MGVVLASYGVAVVTFFIFASYFQLYQMGLVILVYSVYLTVCGALDKNKPELPKNREGYCENRFGWSNNWLISALSLCVCVCKRWRKEHNYLHLVLIAFSCALSLF